MKDDERVLIVLPPKAFQKVLDLIENPPKPSERLKAAVKRYYGKRKQSR